MNKKTILPKGGGYKQVCVRFTILTIYNGTRRQPL